MLKEAVTLISDFRWYATDSIGEITVFTTAGFGAIPMNFFRDSSKYLELEKYLNTLATKSDYLCIGNSTFIEDGYKVDAERGLYSYDWNSEASSYEKAPYSLLASPTRPLTVSDLDKDRTLLLETVKFRELYI